MKQVKLVKICPNETCSRVWVGKHLSDVCPIVNGFKKGDDLWLLLLNITFGYAIRKVRVKQDDLKLNGTHQLLVYADDVNILGGSVHTIKNNTEAFLVGSKEIGLEVNADKTQYIVMSRNQNAELSR